MSAGNSFVFARHRISCPSIGYFGTKRPTFRNPLILVTILVSDAGLNGEVSNDDHSISSDVPPDLAHDGDSVDSEREALNLVSTARLISSTATFRPVACLAHPWSPPQSGKNATASGSFSYTSLILRIRKMCFSVLSGVPF